MNFCLFYAWREMRRRPMRFVSLGCFLGIYSFVISSVYGIVMCYSGNVRDALLQAGILLLFLLGLMTLMVCFLCQERYRACAAEYEAMQMYGLTEAGLQKIHIIQMLMLSAIVISMTQLLSVVFCRMLMSRNLCALAALKASVEQAWPAWYVSRAEIPLVSFPTTAAIGYAVCAVLMLVSGFSASLWADHLCCCGRTSSIVSSLAKQNGGVICNWTSYRRLTYARIRKSLWNLRVVSAAAFFLPVFLFGASLLFNPVSALGDMTVSIAETAYTEVDAALTARIIALVGEEHCQIIRDGDAVFALQLMLDDQTWIQTAGEILAIPGIEAYYVSVSLLSRAVSGIKSDLLCRGFAFLALVSLLAACISIFYVIADQLRARAEEFRVLTMFGIRSLFRLKAAAVFRMLLPGSIAVSITAVLLVRSMNLSGGAVEGTWVSELLFAGIGAAVVLPILFALCAARFICPEMRE